MPLADGALVVRTGLEHAVQRMESVSEKY